MHKVRPYEKIALHFQISRESAKYFLNHVQKSFRKERPAHTLILEFVESQDFEVLPTPYEVAELMYEHGAWVYALGTPPPILMSADDLETD